MSFLFTVWALAASIESMALTLTFLGVAQVVVHELPEAEHGKRVQPVLSEVVEDPGQDTRDFFKDRTVQSLMTAGRSIQFQANPLSRVPDLVREYLDGDSSNLLRISQDCARHLATCQESGSISPGLLCVAGCTYKTRPAFALVKLESQEGVRLERKEPKHGRKRSLSLQSVKDLILSEGTRVFKVGLFVKNGKSIEALVSDHQVPRTSIRGVAQFYLDQFLGCELTELPEVTTARFYQAARDFINSIEDDPQRAYNYDAALHTELMSAASNINPSTFARRHLEPRDRPAFLKHVKERRIPDAGFDKDNKRIESHLKVRLIEFQSGLKLVGSVKSFDKHVNVKNKKEVVVRDEIEKFGRST